MSALTIQDQLSASHAKLVGLQNQIKPLEGIVIETTPPAITLEQIQLMIDKGVADKLEALGQSPNVVSKQLTPLECINELFTPDEVAWLCNPAVLRGVDNFIMNHYIQTENGKTALKELFADYRSYYESIN